MKVIASTNSHVVTGDGFISERFVLADDNMGYSMSVTKIPQGTQKRWHYKNHRETCYCITGSATIQCGEEEYSIMPGSAYLVTEKDSHLFIANTDVVLVCVFNPPLTGDEVHDDEGAYTEKLSPVYGVRRVPIEQVTANDYNPNSVAPPEMELLETSIWEDGYTQPVVTVYDEANDRYVVVDGFHRFLTLKNSKRIYEREQGMLPVVVLKKEMSDRMASTIRHNRARGSHNVELMSTIVSELVEMGKGDAWICKHIGMSKDELLRMKQITGLASLFANEDFSQSWDAELNA